MFLIHQMSVSMFRLMGAIGRTIVIATTMGSTLVLFIVTLSGFVLAYPQVIPGAFTCISGVRQIFPCHDVVCEGCKCLRVCSAPIKRVGVSKSVAAITLLAAPQIHPWTIWGFWISPLMYAQQALSINEFLAGVHLHSAALLNPPASCAKHQVHVVLMRWSGCEVELLIMSNVVFVVQPAGRHHTATARWG